VSGISECVVRLAVTWLAGRHEATVPYGGPEAREPVKEVFENIEFTR